MKQKIQKNRNRVSRNLKFCALAIMATLTFSSCSDDDTPPAAVNEEELITTVTVVYTPVGGGTAITLEYTDLDGEGPNQATKTISGAFAPNTTYNGVITFKNESVNPAEDITEEIEEEAEEHQIFYQKTGTLNAFTYGTADSNFDANDNPIGLESVFTTTGAATGTLTITLIHEPNKNAIGVAAGDISNAGGSTDAVANFNISVAGTVEAIEIR